MDTATFDNLLRDERRKSYRPFVSANPVLNENLLLLLRYHMVHLPPDNVNMNYVRVDEATTTGCGTIGCAMGHATTMPEFRQLGLEWKKPEDPRDGTESRLHLNGECLHNEYDTAAHKLFGLDTCHQAEILFGPLRNAEHDLAQAAHVPQPLLHQWVFSLRVDLFLEARKEAAAKIAAAETDTDA